MSTGFDVEAVLVAHHAEVQIKGDKPIGWRCSAGDWISSGTHGDGTEFAAHVAAVLRVEIESALAGVLRDAAADWKDLERTIERTEWAIADAEDEPFRFTPAERMRIAVCEWLTDRADQLDPHRPTLAADEGDGR